MTDQSPAPYQLGNGYTAYPTVDGHGQVNGWAIYDRAEEYVDTAYNLAGAVEFAAGHAEHQAEAASNPPAACDHDPNNPNWIPCAQCRAEFHLTDPARQPRAWVQKGISPGMMSFHWGMTALTFGLWSPVLILALLRGKRRMVAKY